jgi:hypothetical protein
VVRLGSQNDHARTRWARLPGHGQCGQPIVADVADLSAHGACPTCFASTLVKLDAAVSVPRRRGWAAVAAKAEPLQAVVMWFEIDHLQVPVNADVNPVEKASQACYPKAGEVG